MKTVFFCVSLVNGNAMAENPLMSFLKNWINPRKLQTSLTVLGAGYFWIAFTFLGFIYTPSLVIL